MTATELLLPRSTDQSQSQDQLRTRQWGKRLHFMREKSRVVQLLGINTERGEELEPFFKTITRDLQLCDEINNIPILCSRIFLPHRIDTLIFS